MRRTHFSFVHEHDGLAEHEHHVPPRWEQTDHGHTVENLCVHAVVGKMIHRSEDRFALADSTTTDNIEF